MIIIPKMLKFGALESGKILVAFRFTDTARLEGMMRKIICLTLLTLPLTSIAGVCETAWDGDKIISTLSGRSSGLRIPLKDRNQATNEITLGHLQAFHEAKDRISRVVGISPKFVVCGDREPNAFAISGSSGEVVAVSIGMLNLTNGDRDMAAASIGHEFAHLIKQHGANSQVRETALGVIGLIAGVALEYNLQKKHGIENLGLELGQTGAVLTNRKFDRDQEREADDLGFQYMISAGYNPEGAVRFWERMSHLGGGGGGWFYDTHPGSAERTELFKTKISNSPQAQQAIAMAKTGTSAAISAASGSSERTWCPDIDDFCNTKGYKDDKADLGKNKLEWCPDIDTFCGQKRVAR